MKRPRKDLTPQQYRFVQQYVESGNASQSYLSAYKKTGRSRTHYVNAYRLLKTARIQEAIEFERAKDAERCRVTRAKVAREWAAMAFSNLADCFDKEGNPLKPHEIPRSAQRAIQSYEIKADGTVKIKMYPKTMPLLKLAIRLGYLTETPSQNVNVGSIVNVDAEELFRRMDERRETAFLESHPAVMNGSTNGNGHVQSAD